MNEFLYNQVPVAITRQNYLTALPLNDRIVRAKKAKRRREYLAKAGGKHSRKDICEILSLQKDRCIYCNVRFTASNPPTRDHFTPVVYGGTNSPLNIVIACRSCNSRRCDIPFRTYCKLLSPTQNRRIVAHLSRRLLGLDLDNMPDKDFAEFCTGLALHDSRHGRYRWILRMFAFARKNAAKNRILPCVPHLIVKRASG